MLYHDPAVSQDPPEGAIEMKELPGSIDSEEQLEDLLSRPNKMLVDLMRRLQGDIIVLGAAGKMGVSLTRMAVRAAREAGSDREVIAVSRFSNPAAKAEMETYGARTIACDLLDRDAVQALPRAENVIYMAGKKFGTAGQEEITWAMNVVAPANVACAFADSRIVAFSTGCVYPLVEPESGGCAEDTPPAPIGEYAQSCLGRERVFAYYSRTRNTRVCLIRLNYAVEMRYGVLHDIARQVFEGKTVNATVPCANAIWQADANAQALLALEVCTTPANILNVTGPETFSVAHVAGEFAALFGGRKIDIVTGDRRVGYLNNAAKATALFGYPTVPLKRIVEWTAHWIAAGGRGLDKPTHFEVNTGNF